MMAKALTGRFVLTCYLVFLGIAALSGGTSLYYSPSQPVVRLAAIMLIGAIALRASKPTVRSYRAALWFLAALALLVLIQLVPLPPWLWGALPGRERYLSAAIAAGEPQPWRPINLAPDRGWNTLFGLLPPAAALLAASRLQMRDQAIVLTAFLLIAMTSAILGLAQISTGSDGMRLYAASPTGSAEGLFANRNHQALLIACGLPMLSVWATRAVADRAKLRLRGALALGSAAFLVLMIPTTGSRAGLALAALALPFAILLVWPSLKSSIAALPQGRRPIAIWGTIVTLATLIAASLTFSRAEAVQRLFEADPIGDARFRLIGPLIGMIRDFWPVGSGFGTFDPVYRGFEPFGNLSATIMNQAHDDYLQVVMEAGLPGAVLLTVFICWWAWVSLQLWRRPGGDGTAFGRLGSVIILLMMLASLVDYPVRMPLMMVLAAQSASWMLLPRRRRSDRGELRIATGSAAGGGDHIGAG